jgi:hypothetical protein
MKEYSSLSRFSRALPEAFVGGKREMWRGLFYTCVSRRMNINEAE